MRITSRRPRLALISFAAGLLMICAACFSAPQESEPREAFFIGIDVSGSFESSGRYDDALAFAARYIHGHLQGYAELAEPRALFVGSIGGDTPDQTQGFHPIHDFEGKSIEQIEADLRRWFPSNDQLTDFNTFFERVASLTQRNNLVLAPINIVVLSDGVPDPGAGLEPAESTEELYAQIDLSPLEYLARNVTVRLLYPDPDVAVNWERHIDYSRVRMWTVDRVVMGGWRAQWQAMSDPDAAGTANATGQDDLWRWIQDNVDFRVRRGVL